MDQITKPRYWKRILIWLALVVSLNVLWWYYGDYAVDAYARLFGIHSSNLGFWQLWALFTVLPFVALLLASVIGVWNKKNAPPFYVGAVAIWGPMIVLVMLQIAVAICSNNPDFECSLGRIMPR